MPNLTTLNLVSGSASNTGTISTLDNSFGTAGTSNANVISVQGIAGGTNLPVTGTVTATVSNSLTAAVSGVSVTASSLVVSSTSNLPVNISGPVVTVSGSSAVNASLAGITVSSNALQIYGSLSASNVTLSGVSVTSSSLQVVVQNGNANGRAVPGGSAPVVMASQGYQSVASSQTNTILGSTGSTGDWLDGILVIPASVSPGNVLLVDLSTSTTVFAGGTTSLTNLVPFFLPIGAVSKNGPWKITTGSSVSVIAMGNFT